CPTVVSVVWGGGCWWAVIEPFLGARGLTPGDQVWAASVPLLDAVALAIALRTALQVRFRYPSAILIAAGLGCQLGSDLARSAQELSDTFGWGGVLAALSVAAP